jgi:hypothetical protein
MRIPAAPYIEEAFGMSVVRRSWYRQLGGS